MLKDCFIFVLNNKFYFVIELLSIVFNIFIMVKITKKCRKSFLCRFFSTAVFCIILDIIYRLFIFDFDFLHDMNILQKFFGLIFSMLGTYAFFLIATFSLLNSVAFLVTYIIMTIHEKKNGAEI